MPSMSVRRAARPFPRSRARKQSMHGVAVRICVHVCALIIVPHMLSTVPCLPCTRISDSCPLVITRSFLYVPAAWISSSCVWSRRPRVSSCWYLAGSAADEEENAHAEMFASAARTAVVDLSALR